MKKAVTIFFVSGFISSLFAQRSFILSHLDKQGYVNISGGVSIPTSSLSRDDASAPSKLMAFSGSSLQVTVGYRLGRHWGAVASLTNCINDGNAAPMIENLEKGKLGTNWTARAGTWNCAHLMAGPTYSSTIDRWTFDQRITAGYSWVERPNTEIMGKYYQLDMGVQTSASNSKSFTVGVGTTIRYKIGRNFSLATHIDYLSTRSNFENIETTITMGQDKATEPVKAVSPIGILTLNGGLSLLF